MKKHLKKPDASSRLANKSSNFTASDFLSRVDGYPERTKAILVFLLILVIGVLAFKEYLLMHSVFLFKDIGSDTLNYNYPNWLHLSSYLREVGIPKWSFAQGMGQNIFYTAEGINDPFCWPLYLLGNENLPYGIGYMELCKVLAGGIFFYLYLRMLGFTFYSCMLGALMFSFCGYMILGGTWIIFSSEAVGASFLLFAFEKFYKQKSWAWLPFAVAYLIMVQPFHIYLYGLLLGIYAIIRFVNQGKFEVRKFFLFLSRVMLCGILGAGMASVFMLPAFLQILESPRGGGDVSYFNFLSGQPVFKMADSLNNASVIMRFFSNDMLGSGNNFSGWQNYLESPILYCGLPALLLFPHVFFFSSSRERIIYAGLIAGCLLAAFFPFFRYTFWIYTGNYYRTFSFFFSLLILFYAIRALNHIDSQRKINLKLLASTLIVLVLLLCISYGPLPGNKLILVDQRLKNIALFLLFVYAILIALIGNKKSFSMPRLLLLIIICVELSYFSSLTLNRRDAVKAKELTQKVSYNDYTVDALTFLKKQDKGFYRIDKDYNSGNAIHQSMNDAKAQNYYGTSSYYPFNQSNYIHFLEGVGIIPKPNNDPNYPMEYKIQSAEANTRWAQGLGSRPILESLTGVKFNLLKNRNALKFGFDSIAKFGDVIVTRNRYCLPLGVAFNRYVFKNDFDNFSPTQKDFTLLRAFVVENEKAGIYRDILRFEVKDTLSQYTGQLYDSFIRQLSDTLLISEHTPNKIQGKIHLNEKKLLFFSIPYDKGWSAIVDGEKSDLQLVNFGFMGLLLGKGDHVITMSYHPPLMYAGGIISFASLALFFIIIGYEKRRTRPGII